VALLLCLAVQVVSATTVHTLALFTGCAGTNVQTPSAAVVSHASMGQPGNLTTIFLCDEISNGASEAWPSCRLPAIVADVISPRDTGGHHHEAHPRNHDWLLLIGSNFIFKSDRTYPFIALKLYPFRVLQYLLLFLVYHHHCAAGRSPLGTWAWNPRTKEQQYPATLTYHYTHLNGRSHLIII